MWCHLSLVSPHEAMGNREIWKGKFGIQRPSRSVCGGCFIWFFPIMPGYSTLWYLLYVFANPKLSLKTVWKFAMKQYYRHGSLSFNGCIYFFFIIFKIILMWPFLESFIGFITISLLFYVLVFWWEAWDLSFTIRGRTHPLALEGEILTTGPTGTSPMVTFKISIDIWFIYLF